MTSLIKYIGKEIRMASGTPERFQDRISRMTRGEKDRHIDWCSRITSWFVDLYNYQNHLKSSGGYIRVSPHECNLFKIPDINGSICVWWGNYDFEFNRGWNRFLCSPDELRTLIQSEKMPAAFTTRAENSPDWPGIYRKEDVETEMIEISIPNPEVKIYAKEVIENGQFMHRLERSFAELFFRYREDSINGMMMARDHESIFLYAYLRPPNLFCETHVNTRRIAKAGNHQLEITEGESNG